MMPLSKNVPHPELAPAYRHIAMVENGFGAAFVVLVLMQTAFPRARRVTFPLATIVVSIWFFTTMHPFDLYLQLKLPLDSFVPSVSDFAVAAVVLVGSMAVDTLCVAFLRFLFRKAQSGALPILHAAYVAPICGAVAWVLFFPPWSNSLQFAVARALGGLKETVLALTWEANSIDGWVCLLLFVVFIVLVLNRLTWRFVSRVLHAVAAERLLNKRGWLWAAGVGLAADALTNHLATLVLLLKG
jgi:hypothetical protein